MRAFALAVGLLPVCVWAQTTAPSGSATPQLKGVTADTVSVSLTVLQNLAVSEPDIPAPDKTSQPAGVLLRVLVSKTGTVEEAVSLFGPADLARVGIEGVKGWKYHPYLVDGEPREIQSTIALGFADGMGRRLPPPPPPPAPGGPGVAGMAGTSGSSGAMTGWATSGAPPVVQRQMPQGAVPVSAGIVSGLALHTVAPVYPPLAKAAHVQGVVVLHAVLSKTGTIEDLQVISGPPLLVGAAMDAVKQWTYKPYLLNGDPVEVQTTINVNFTFAGKPAPAPGGNGSSATPASAANPQ